LLKEYFRHPGDARDRLKAEFDFTKFAWAAGIRCIPEPVANDIAEGVALFSFIDGNRIAPGTLTAADIKQAIEFVVALNSYRNIPEARKLLPGSEACFSISQHLDMMNKRLDRLSRILPVSSVDYEALEFVSTKLVPAHLLVVKQLLACVEEGEIALAIDLLPDEQIISPSDFGFHNALRRPDGSIAFLDFEYAGWDDPAKLTGDFFSQVAVPVPLTYKNDVLNAIADILPDPESAWKRMNLLLPLYRIKWCCIVLNHFLPVDSSRKNFAQGNVSEEFKAGQLAKADSLLASLKQLNICTKGD